jgi:hypothetical protein
VIARAFPKFFGMLIVVLKRAMGDFGGTERKRLILLAAVEGWPPLLTSNNC